MSDEYLKMMLNNMSEQIKNLTAEVNKLQAKVIVITVVIGSGINVTPHVLKMLIGG